MQTVTMACPPAGLQAYFQFKEPVTRYLQNRLGTTVTKFLLRVSAINELREMLQSELRDPYLEAYAPSEIPQAQYTQDLKDNIQILTFKYTAPDSTVKYIRIPLTMVASYADVAEVYYFDRNIVLNLGLLPESLDTSILRSELVDFVRARTGVIATVKEVQLGDPVAISQELHTTNETVRTNSITVYKSLTVQLEEMTVKHHAVLQRLQDIGITLG